MDIKLKLWAYLESCPHTQKLEFNMEKLDNIWLVFGDLDCAPEGYRLVSLHIRSMWETICDAQAGFWLNSKFLSKFSRKPLSGISDQKAPPPPGKLQIWDDQSLLWNAPPQWKTSDLRWPKFTSKYPPQMENFRFEMTKVYSEIPPPNGKLQIWDDQSLLWNTPTPQMENFRFEMTKVYSEIPPQMENIRFEMTKVYSKIPPPKWKTSDLRWPKFTLKYRDFVNTHLLIHKHVKIGVDEWILETTRPQKHVKFLE